MLFMHPSAQHVDSDGILSSSILEAESLSESSHARLALITIASDKIVVGRQPFSRDQLYDDLRSAEVICKEMLAWYDHGYNLESYLLHRLPRDDSSGCAVLKKEGLEQVKADLWRFRQRISNETPKPLSEEMHATLPATIQMSAEICRMASRLRSVVIGENCDFAARMVRAIYFMPNSSLEYAAQFEECPLFLGCAASVVSERLRILANALDPSQERLASEDHGNEARALLQSYKLITKVSASRDLVHIDATLAPRITDALPLIALPALTVGSLAQRMEALWMISNVLQEAHDEKIDLARLAHLGDFRAGDILDDLYRSCGSFFSARIQDHLDTYRKDMTDQSRVLQAREHDAFGQMLLDLELAARVGVALQQALIPYTTRTDRWWRKSNRDREVNFALRISRYGFYQCDHLSTAEQFQELAALLGYHASERTGTQCYAERNEVRTIGGLLRSCSEALALAGT